jgi:hypothetical protein
VKVTIFKACRSPETVKQDTEGIVLSKVFAEEKLDFTLFSNDEIWPEHCVITKSLIEMEIKKPDVSVVHLAMHGLEDGLALRWSSGQDFTQKVIEDLLDFHEIQEMAGWQQKLIVSGACNSLHFADAFLQAGALAVVAPGAAIPWNELGAFFQVFYRKIFKGLSVKAALDSAKSQFPKYASFNLSGRDVPILPAIVKSLSSWDNP